MCCLQCRWVYRYKNRPRLNPTVNQFLRWRGYCLAALNRIKWVAVVALTAASGLSWFVGKGEMQSPPNSAKAGKVKLPLMNQTSSSLELSGRALGTGAQQPPLFKPSPSKTQPDARVPALRTEFLKVVGRERFAPLQIHLEQVSCDAQRCQVDLVLPPHVEASQRRDPRVASDMLKALNDQLKSSGAEVGIMSLSHLPTGMSMQFEVNHESKESARYYTDSDIAKIRADTLKEHLDANSRK
jgi:hypothetical protein